MYSWSEITRVIALDLWTWAIAALIVIVVSACALHDITRPKQEEERPLPPRREKEENWLSRFLGWAADRIEPKPRLAAFDEDE